MVNDKDIVATLPPAILGYRHIDDLVFISENGHIKFVGEGAETKSDETEVSAAVQGTPKVFITEESDGNEPLGERAHYDKKVKSIPKPLRDHMPDFYLKPMMKMASTKAANETGIEVGL